MRAIVLTAAVAFLPTVANADGLDPANADVIMRCYTNDKPGTGCMVECGTFQNAPGAPPIAARYAVESVELYTHGKATQGYDRQWVILNQKGAPTPFRTAIYLAANMSCTFALQVTNGSYPNFVVNELRVEKFNQ